MAFVFLKFIFSITSKFNDICKVMIQLRNLHLTLKIQFWNDNVPSKTMTNISRTLPEMILKHKHAVTYSINLNLENYNNLNLENFTFASTDSLRLALILLSLVFFEFSFCDRILGSCFFLT